LASAYNDLKKFREAMIHYNRAIELDEENIDAYVCKGSIFEQL
jgi:tetratricopeptide (TPR) repeat protein